MREEARWKKLVKGNQFRRVCEGGKKYRGSYLLVYLLPSPDGACLAGISVGKRVGNAVKRNRAKRLIREALRCSLDRIVVRVWIVCVAKKEIVNKSLSQVEGDLLKILEQAGVCQ